MSKDLMKFILVKIWIQNVGDIDLNMSSAIENSRKFQTQQKVQPQWQQHHCNQTLGQHPHKKQTLKNVCDDAKVALNSKP